MKKLLLIAALLFASYGAFAEEMINDFDALVVVLKTQLEKQGVEVRSDRATNTIFFDSKVPKPSNGVTQEQLDAMKPVMIRGMKDRDKDGKTVQLFKRLKIKLVYNFVTTDGVKYQLVISHEEL